MTHLSEAPLKPQKSPLCPIPLHRWVNKTCPHCSVGALSCPGPGSKPPRASPGAASPPWVTQGLISSSALALQIPGED